MKHYPLVGSFAILSLLFFAVPISEARFLHSAASVGNSITQAPTSSDRLTIPPILDQGFEAYRQDGIRAGMKTWLRNSPSYIKSQAEVSIGSMEGMLQGFGNYTGYSVIDSTAITESTQVIYLEAKYQRGTCFMMFVIANTQGIPVITAFNFNSDPTQVLPGYLFYPQQ